MTANNLSSCPGGLLAEAAVARRSAEQHAPVESNIREVRNNVGLVVSGLLFGLLLGGVPKPVRMHESDVPTATAKVQRSQVDLKAGQRMALYQVSLKDTSKRLLNFI